MGRRCTELRGWKGSPKVIQANPPPPRKAGPLKKDARSPVINHWPTRTTTAFLATRTHCCLTVNCWPTTDQPGHQQPSWPPGYPAGSWSVCGQPLANRWPTRTPLALLATRAHCCLMVTLLANRWPPGPPGPSVQSSSPAAQPPSPPLCPGTPPGAAVCPT